MVRGPIWGINSLSTFILSSLYGVCSLTEVYLTVHKWTFNESDFFGIPEFHSMFTQIYSLKVRDRLKAQESLLDLLPCNNVLVYAYEYVW